MDNINFDWFSSAFNDKFKEIISDSPEDIDVTSSEVTFLGKINYFNTSLMLAPFTALEKEINYIVNSSTNQFFYMDINQILDNYNLTNSWIKGKKFTQFMSYLKKWKNNKESSNKWKDNLQIIDYFKELTFGQKITLLSQLKTKTVAKIFNITERETRIKIDLLFCLFKIRNHLAHELVSLDKYWIEREINVIKNKLIPKNRQEFFTFLNSELPLTKSNINIAVLNQIKKLLNNNEKNLFEKLLKKYSKVLIY